MKLESRLRTSLWRFFHLKNELQEFLFCRKLLFFVENFVMNEKPSDLYKKTFKSCFGENCDFFYKLWISFSAYSKSEFFKTSKASKIAISAKK